MCENFNMMLFLLLVTMSVALSFSDVLGFWNTASGEGVALEPQTVRKDIGHIFDSDTLFKNMPKELNHLLHSDDSLILKKLRTMRLDVKETPKEYLVHVDLPGVAKENVNITVTNHVLEVSSERKFEKSSENESILRSERYFGKFSRYIQLPADVSEDQITAKFENGVLELEVPRKAEKQRGRSIAISGSS